MDTVWYYMAYYKQSLMGAWNNLTPSQYGYLLTVIAGTAEPAPSFSLIECSSHVESVSAPPVIANPGGGAKSR